MAHAFNDKANPLGVKINAIYSSDVGHWDVPDLTEVLAESRALVDDGATRYTQISLRGILVVSSFS